MLLLLPAMHLFAQTEECNRSAVNLFDDTTVLDCKLYTNFRNVLRDRDKKPVYHGAKLLYKNSLGKDVILPLKIKARGNFRKDRNVCDFPPLLLHFSKHTHDSANLFSDQQNLKLVTHCQGDAYVIQEWMVYKIYNLLTPFSFHARLVKMDYADSSLKGKTETHYGILIEDETKMAQRNASVLVKRKMITQQATRREPYLIMALFQYMIGNTDWSVPYLHNIRLVATDSTEIPFTVPYDFDHAGIVRAPYAKPAEELNLISAQEMLYRGFCLPVKDFDEVITTYNEKKAAIYDAYTHCVLLQPKYIKQTLAYLDDFYKTINNKKLMKVELERPCSAEVQNIEIKRMPDSD